MQFFLVRAIIAVEVAKLSWSEYGILFVVITAAFVLGQVLTLLIFKPTAILRRKAAAAPEEEESAKLRTRGGNWFGGGIRR